MWIPPVNLSFQDERDAARRTERETIRHRIEYLEALAITEQEARNRKAVRLTSAYRVRQFAQCEMLIRVVDRDFQGRNILLVKRTDSDGQVKSLEVWRSPSSK